MQKKVVNVCLLFLLIWAFLITSCSQDAVGNAVLNPEEKKENADDPLTDKFNEVVMGVAEAKTDVEQPTLAVEEQQEVVQAAIVQPVKEENNDSSNNSKNKETEPEPIIEIAEPNTIYMKKNAFSPSNLKIRPGETITWKNDDTKLHIINMYVNNPFPQNNPKIDPGEDFSFTFTEPETYKYQDAILKDKMRGQIIVE